MQFVQWVYSGIFLPRRKLSLGYQETLIIYAIKEGTLSTYLCILNTQREMLRLEHVQHVYWVELKFYEFVSEK